MRQKHPRQSMERRSARGRLCGWRLRAPAASPGVALYSHHAVHRAAATARRSRATSKSVQLPLQLTAHRSSSSDSAQEPRNKQKCAAPSATHSAQSLEQERCTEAWQQSKSVQLPLQLTARSSSSRSDAQKASKTPIRCSLYKSHTASLTTPQVSRHETCVRLAERDTLFKRVSRSG